MTGARSPTSRDSEAQDARRARHIQQRIPSGGLFAGHEWRLAPEPFSIDPGLAARLEQLGRILLKFYQAVNLLYRHSFEGRQPSWIADLLDQGKQKNLVALQKSAAFKNHLPRVIRPDILITETGFSITELDSVPGGIGLTAWLNQGYSEAPGSDRTEPVLGGPDGMLKGFAGMFQDAPRVHVVVSEEAATYRPEMVWLTQQLGEERFQVCDTSFREFAPGEAVYRFFELFDLDNVPSAQLLFQLAQEGTIQLTPPPKPIFEEKLLFGLLWNRNLEGFWHRELGAGFLKGLRQAVPYTWILDPTPLPPQAAFPELDITDWRQLKSLSKRQRDLILKISGFSELAWGARGVYLGSDLSAEAWSQAVDEAIRSFPRAPFVLQRYHKPKSVSARYFDFQRGRVQSMPGRVRLCPYYFVHGDGTAARPQLGGVLATICPADKKIIHGMKEAIMAPCTVSATENEDLPNP